MSDWIEYKNEKGQTVYFNKTVSDQATAQPFIKFLRIDWHHKFGEAWVETADSESEVADVRGCLWNNWLIGTAATFKQHFRDF